MEVSWFTNITFFLCIIAMHYLFVSWIEVTVCFLTASYAAARIILFLDGFCVPWYWRESIWSVVLVTCNSIGTNICHDLLLISSDLDTENNLMEVSHVWVFGVKSVGMRASSIVFLNISLIMFPSDTLKSSRASTKTEFMWWVENFFVSCLSIYLLFTKLYRGFILTFFLLSLVCLLVE